MLKYLPEGQLYNTLDNRNAMRSIYSLQECAQTGKILEARTIICDNEHNLIVDLGSIRGLIPRCEGALGIEDGTTRDIALISRVNKAVCFKITDFAYDRNKQLYAVLSRRAVQQECMNNYISKLSAGDVIPARVTHIEQFGSFVDIGCGIPSLIPIDAISVSRISHPCDRFNAGQDIRVVVKSVEESGRIYLSHKELLGSWGENASSFTTGETVAGIVRSVEDYGIFIELTPNLAGLAEPKPNVRVGQHCSVYIKAIIPEKMKIKLVIVDVFDARYPNKELKYYCGYGHIDCWRYSCENSDRIIETMF